MRIAYDSDIFSMQTYGGVSRYFVRLAEELIGAGEDVRVFAPIYQNRHLRMLPPSAIHGLAVDQYVRRTGRIMTRVNGAMARLCIKRWRPDIVHETYYSRRSSSGADCPAVITVYDMIHELFAHELPSKDRTTEIKRIAINRAAHVICISHSTRKDLLELFGLDPAKASVVHLGFERLTDVPMEACGADGPGKPYLLYVGSRQGYKNFNTFLHAVASHARLRREFDVVAFGGGAFNAEEAALVRDLGFSDGQVRHVGGDDRVLGSFYRGAVCLVYPSLYEGFGLPPLEAMANRCPVVSSNTSSMPEVIGEAGEYFDPASAEDMASAVERVVYSSETRDRLIERGSVRLNNFSWKKCGAETRKIYRELGANS
jgi:glycosyltransferase involved in cell wall biosynthesis